MAHSLQASGRWLRYSLGTLPFAALGLFYWYGRARLGVPDHFLPPASAVWSAARELFLEQHFATDIAASVWRMVAGFLVAALLAWPLGLLMGTNRHAYAVLSPLFGFIRYLPLSVVIPLCVLWFGIGEAQKIIVIFLGAFFQMCLMIADAAAGVYKEYFECARTLGASRLQQVLHVLLPASLPGTIDSLRLNFGLAWTFLIFAELLGADSGVGYVVARSQRYLLTGHVMVCVVFVGGIGILSDVGFRLLLRVACPWAKKLHEVR